MKELIITLLLLCSVSPDKVLYEAEQKLVKLLYSESENIPCSLRLKYDSLLQDQFSSEIERNEYDQLVKECNPYFKNGLERKRRKKWLKFTDHQQRRRINDPLQSANVTDNRKHRIRVQSRMKDNSTGNLITNNNNPIVMNDMEVRKTFEIENDTIKTSTTLNSMEETIITNDNSKLEYIEPSYNTFSTAGLINTSGNVTANSTKLEERINTKKCHLRALLIWRDLFLKIIILNLIQMFISRFLVQLWALHLLLRMHIIL